MAVHLHDHDLPEGLDLGPVVAIDSETMGLKPHRDRLCLIQLSAGDGDAHLIRVLDQTTPAPRLTAMLADPNVEKLFHFGRFDIAVMANRYGVLARPVWCTKIASKLVRTYTDRHGLKALCQEILGLDISKQQQSSDWGDPNLTDAQKDYAASDVLYLHRLKEALEARLEREGRREMAEAAYRYLPDRAALDLAGWPDDDIFAH